MIKTNICSAIRRAIVQGALRRGGAAGFLAAALALAPATRAQSETSPTQSLVSATNQGTLLSSGPEDRNFLASPAVGALTLASQSQTSLPATFVQPEVITPSTSLARAVTNSEFIAPSVNSFTGESGSLVSASAWQASESFALQDITPVPEPATWLAAFLALALLAWQQRRRLLLRVRSKNSVVPAKSGPHPLLSLFP